jgi:hypothetical protein
MGKMKQTKQNEHHKTIQSRTKPSEGLYKINLEGTDGEETGMFMGMADIKIIYNALKQYTPSKEEVPLYEILLETFEEEIWEDEHKDDEA